MAWRSAKKHKLDDGHSTTGSVNSLSYVPVSQYDAWAYANEEDERHHQTRVSHFIYSVQFNPDPPQRILSPGMRHMIAFATAEHLVIVQLSENGDVVQRNEILVVPDQPNKDNSKQPKPADKEDLYTLTWVKDPINRAEWTAVCFAGSTGVIRILDLGMAAHRTAFLRGHAADVNELRYCTNHPSFLFSCSKDQTMRLWSIKYLQCLAVFGGSQGHKADIISMDVDPMGLYLVSGSYDSCIKIWSLFGQDNKNLLDAVRIHAISSDPQPVVVPAPLFSASDIHDGQIDCVRFVFPGTKNTTVISKASDETILIWMAILPGANLRIPGTSSEWQQCYKMKLTNNKFWFVKFSLLQNSQHLFALGDDKGFIRIHDLEALVKKEKAAAASSSVKTKPNRTSSPNKAVIRSVDFSADGRLLVGGSDDGVCYVFRRKDVQLGSKAVARNRNDDEEVHSDSV